MEIAKVYDPKEAEEHHYKRWESNGFFAPEINEDPDAEKFSVVIPPPNVTGTLHMGHALQHTLMDTLTRWKRMQGYRTLFLVGVDHAGISTQLMVTRQLKKDEHRSPQDIGRDAFTEKVWEWKNKYGNVITEQIRKEGLSVDWTRERFTMEDDLSTTVRNVFVRLYEEGWIYRGTRIVNWCPRDKTVLSDLEVKEEKARDGKLYYLRYPVSEPEAVATRLMLTVATTRPETMLGDTAVAVNPDDERYKHLVGRKILLPLTNREIPIIADAYVESEFGTGAVKITPAHDPNDWEIGQRHNLEMLVIMNEDATMNAAAGADFEGLERYAAREKVVEEFEKLGLLDKIEDYDVTLPHCERCKTVIEPLLSEQWFAKMDEMRDMALKLLREENAPRFFPEVPHKKVYMMWLENLRDWTISRQLWWGHQIPAWYDKDGNVFVAHSKEEASEKAGTTDLVQDQDVLDTWFSSALWPFSTMGWNGSGPGAMATGLLAAENKNPVAIAPVSDSTSDLETFYPTDVLVTGRDIIRLWVSRMVMTGLKFTGKKPFDDVIIHGTVLDKNGQRMSKTKNNGIDPLEVFAKFGVDATRMTLAGSATGIDFAWRDEKVESYRNFANKIWNATRFCLINSDGACVDLKSLEFHLQAASEAALGREEPAEAVPPNASLADRWIISRLNKTAKAVDHALETYQFHEAVQLLYHFFWDDFCDWYIEFVKDEIVNLSDAEMVRDIEAGIGSVPGAVATGLTPAQIQSRTRILTILEQAIRMLHPFMPFLTEELWQKLPGTGSSLHNPAYRSAEKTIMLADFPKCNEAMIDEAAESEMNAVIELITKVRNIRAEMNIKSADKFTVHIAADGAFQQVFKANEPQILKLAKAEKLVIGEKMEVPKASAKAVTANAEIAVPLEGLIDFEKERSRLAGQIEKLNIELHRLNAQLSNVSFVEKAPPEKVNELRERQTEIEQQVKTLNTNLDALN
ncbi:MAG: valine--tRNA ligase [Saprospiraceae bacterium]|nr:valine--tRNA ligase [Pyrinomonadaceae bacterium]